MKMRARGTPVQSSPSEVLLLEICGFSSGTVERENDALSMLGKCKAMLHPLWLIDSDDDSTCTERWQTL